MKINQTQPLRRVTQRDYIANIDGGRRLTLPDLGEGTIYTARLKLDPLQGCLYLYDRPPTEEELDQDYAADFLVDLTDIKPPTTNLLKKIGTRLRGRQNLGSLAMHAITREIIEEPDVRLIDTEGLLLTKDLVSNKLIGELEVTVENGYFMSAFDEGDFTASSPPVPGIERDLTLTR